jgi:hypothetical protein
VIETNISAILVITGALTALAGVGLVVPRQLLDVFLAEKTNDATVILIARHWSLLVALVGGLLIYAAYHPETRVPIMIVAIVEKLALGILVVASPLRKRIITMSVVCADAIMALLYVLYLTQQRIV